MAQSRFKTHDNRFLIILQAKKVQEQSNTSAVVLYQNAVPSLAMRD